ncbi:glutaredoxin family protein [Rossellomorea sp. BNER]|jgi:glutaredoxin|uniref:glutaredoxin family protein n=1 Tax=Rossellomorea sp. BNER TaxID=2962031 RepID=UPI003AF2F5FB|nr:glutaredoxin family protein [Rossellomorea sp. BNER]
MRTVIFYTRKQCPLCVEAKQMLTLIQEDIPYKLVEKDIDGDDDLTEQFGLMIPVVQIDDEIVQYGQIDYFTIRKRLQEK